MVSNVVACDWCGVVTECERRDIDEWVCPECWAHHLEKVRELYDPDDGPLDEEDDDGRG
jgi:hypothetical protein